jgi:hypothetical protein
MPKAARKTITTKKTGGAPDPILKLIAGADLRLQEYRLAANEEAEIRSKIGERNSQRCFFRLPSRFDDFGSGISYGGTQMLEGDIKRIAKNAKEAIKESRRLLRRKRISADAARETIEYWKRHLQERKEAKDWLENELRREQARFNRLWRTSGYGAARRRLVVSKAPAADALKAVLEAKPVTFEGSLALIRFVADRGLYSNLNGLPMGDLDAEVCAPLFRAHDVVRMFGHLLPEPAAALSAVRAEQARRKAA